MAKESKNYKDIINNIAPKDRLRMEIEMDALIKWHDEHPDYNERYGTDKSYWLEKIKAKGFNPIGITVMACEETIILATKEEVEKAWKEFKPEGWWYSVDQWTETREWYIKDAYNGVELDAPKVYCLDNKFKDIIK